jgi:cytochrome c biogenesis protein CcmG/thiol:disulfide interchange protein DsbE
VIDLMKTLSLWHTGCFLGMLMLTWLRAPTIADTSKPMPEVVLQSADGGRVQLADFKGQVILIDFWASWCPPCKTSFPALDAVFREYQSRGAQVLAVNVDERRRDADTFLKAHPHTMPVLFDPLGTSPLAFGVRGMPASFLVDRAGRIRFAHMGYTGDVAEQYRRELNLLLSER